MNKDQIEGNWEQFKGKVKQMWGKLTDDDVALLKANRQEFYGKMQEKYGIAEEEAQRHLDEIEKTSGYRSAKRDVA